MKIVDLNELGHKLRNWTTHINTIEDEARMAIMRNEHIIMNMQIFKGIINEHIAKLFLEEHEGSTKNNGMLSTNNRISKQERGKTNISTARYVQRQSTIHKYKY